MLKPNSIHYLNTVLLITTIVILLFVRADKKEDIKHTDAFNQFYNIFSLETPTNLEFAGEKIPINDMEIYERYDREILTNVYWQSQTLLMIKRAARFFPIIEPILKQNGIPDDFKYLAIAESGLQNVSSPAGAVGYWQFLDKTALRYGLQVNEEVDERYHIEKSTEAACKYFKEAYLVFNNWTLAAASYNMGIEGVKRQLQQQNVTNYHDLYLNIETSRYVFRAVSFKEIMINPVKYGFHILPNHLYFPRATAKVKTEQTIPDLTVLCDKYQLNYKTLKLLNPWLRKPKLTVEQGKSYYISIPKSGGANLNRQDTLLFEQ